MGSRALGRAFYRHPAFFLHRVLGHVGISSFYSRNAVATAICVIGLTACAYSDQSFHLRDSGYGFLEHPGVLGWFAIQLLMPSAVFRIVVKAARNRTNFHAIEISSSSFDFKREIFDPIVQFIGLQTPQSRSLFSLLFSIGMAGFAWNTFQNLRPGILAPLDFWDSVHFPYGYFGSRAYKFYMHALLLPSLVHIFAAIVWINVRALRRMMLRKNIKLAPFNADQCGGLAFLSDLILSPAITALLVSGLAFFGTIYTHRVLDVSTVMGIVVESGVLIVFYVLPTLFIRSAVKNLKQSELRELYRKQETYFDRVMTGELQGTELRDAIEYLKYFQDVTARLDAIPLWPHFAKVFGTFSVIVTLPLITSMINFAVAVIKIPPSPH